MRDRHWRMVLIVLLEPFVGISEIYSCSTSYYSVFYG